MIEESTKKLTTTPDTTKSNKGNLKSNSAEKIVPNYLKPSTGSCHDHCKYGNPHAFEKPIKRPIRRRIAKPPDDHNSVEIFVLVEKKKPNTVKLKPSSESTEIIKQAVSPPSNKSEVSMKQVDSNTKEKQPSPKPASVLKPKPITGRPRSSPNSSGSSSPNNIKETQVLAKRPTSLNSKSLPVTLPFHPNSSVGPTGKRNGNANNTKEANISVPRATLEPKFTTVKSRSSSFSNSSGDWRNNNTKEEKISTKRVASLKSKLVTENSSASVNASGDSRESNTNIGKKPGTSKVLVKKVLVPPIALLSSRPLSKTSSLNARKTRSLKIAVPIKDQSKIRKAEPKYPSNEYVENKIALPIKNQKKNRKSEPKNPSNEYVEEKTIYVIEMETEKKSLASVGKKSLDEGTNSLVIVENKNLDHEETPVASSSYGEDDFEESEYSDSESEYYISEDDEITDMENIETLRGQRRLVLSEEKNDNPMKTRFRRGKVVDPQSTSNRPRKIKFRQGRIMGETEIEVEAYRKKYKRREDLSGNGDSHGPEVVILRHQDVQEKKDSQGLFNNVIKETANKLVEARRSRVKALVGAFETVISLQDKKPTTNTNS